MATIKRNFSKLIAASLPGAILTLAALALLLFVLYTSLACEDSIWGCHFYGFGVIFPIYLIIMQVLDHLNVFSFLILFVVSCAAYLYLFFWMGKILETVVINVYSGMCNLLQFRISLPSPETFGQTRQPKGI